MLYLLRVRILVLLNFLILLKRVINLQRIEVKSIKFKKEHIKYERISIFIGFFCFFHLNDSKTY